MNELVRHQLDILLKDVKRVVIKIGTRVIDN